MRAFSFIQAISAGHNPRLYRDYILEGGTAATLDFKIWGESACLRCFFTEFVTGNKFTLVAHSRCLGLKTGKYTPRDQLVDFSEPGIEGTLYHVVTARGARGGLVWDRAEAFIIATPGA